MKPARPRAQRPTLPTPDPTWLVQVTDDGSRTLFDPTAQIAFHSGSGALSETRHVYLHNSGVADRLAQRNRTSVLEIGLGTGMGFLVTADAAIRCGAELDYCAIECRWLAAPILRLIELDRCVQNKKLVESFLRWRERLGDPLPRGSYRWQVDASRCVTVHHHDVCDCPWDDGASFDAIYFDPFAPEANPELWAKDVLSRMRGLLGKDGRLVTYCVSRPVREALQDVGFEVRRTRGPKSGKREVLIATRSPRANKEA